MRQGDGLGIRPHGLDALEILRVEGGRPFRTAYREVAAALKEGGRGSGTGVKRKTVKGLGAVKTWNAPTSNEAVPVMFKQAIGAGDALRTGAYAKTLTFTLSTTAP
mgnify:CR=1 FL=1